MIIKILKQNFSYKKGENIVLMTDILKKPSKDSVFRDKLAKKWYNELKIKDYNVSFLKYNATYSNNGDLPETCFVDNKKTNFSDVFSNADIIIALNEFSATAPLHKNAKKYKFRAASMPGFNKEMIPALDIDYKDVKKKVNKTYKILNKADSAEIVFEADKKKYNLFLDLHSRKPLNDAGHCSKKGQVINLPSGECFIAPLDTEKSKTKGYLPIQETKDSEVVIYEIKNNFIINADKQTKLLKKIKQDKAVGNIAEFAFGVLGLYNIKSCGRTLLDEKLGMHIALGRNDHFSGNIGPGSFMKKQNIWHQDYVYIKEMQPKISINKVKINKNKKSIEIIRENKYKIF